MENQEKANKTGQDLEIDLFKVDFKVFLITFRRKLKYIILVSIASFIAFAVMAKIMIKVKWPAQCTLLRNQSQTFEQKDLPQLYKPLDMNTLVETIRTRRNIEAVIKKLNLKISVDALYAKTTISKDKNSNIIKIMAKDDTPQGAADIANTLSDVFIEQYVNILNSSAKKVYEYYKLNRDEINQRIVGLEKVLTDFKSKHRLLSIESQTAVKFDQLKTAELKLMENSMLEEAMKIKIEDATRNIAGMQKDVQLSYTISSDDQKTLQGMETELAQLRQKFTDQNPRVQRLSSEIDFLKKNPKKGEAAPEKIVFGDNELRRNQEQEKMASLTMLKTTQRNSDELRREILRLKEELSSMSGLETEYMDIVRKLSINRELLKSVENILALSQAAINSTTVDVEVLERAVPARSHVGSKKKLIAIAGGIIGFIIAALAVILFEFLDFSVKSRMDLEKLAGLRVIGELPYKDHIEQNRFFAALQMLYDQILSGRNGATRPPLISCASCEEESGRSFIINGLTEFAANQNKKVLSIDTVINAPEDIRPFLINPYLYDNKETEPEFNHITEHWDKAYFELNEKTYLVPLEAKKFEHFRTLLQKYDLIFFELPIPGKNIQLFSIFAGASDVTAIIGSFRHSNKFKLKKCVTFLQGKKITNLVGILNRVESEYYDNAG